MIRCLPESPAAMTRVGIKAAILSSIMLAIMFLSGCYEVAEEIIRAQDAVRVPPACCKSWVNIHEGLEKGHTCSLRAIPGGNDYQFQDRHENGELSDDACVRFAPLINDIYITQYVSDYIAVTFFRMTANGEIWEVKIPDNTDREALAERYGATFDGEYLTGPRENVMAFLRAHKNLKFVEVEEWGENAVAVRKADQEAKESPSLDSDLEYRVVYGGTDGLNVRSSASLDSEILAAVFPSDTPLLGVEGPIRSPDGRVWIRLAISGWMPIKGREKIFLSSAQDGIYAVVWDRPGDRFVSMRTGTGVDFPLVAKVISGTRVEGATLRQIGSIEYVYATLTGWVVMTGPSGTQFMERR